MGQLEDLLGRQQQIANNIEKSCNDGFDLNQELEKARSGIYADNAKNRRLNRVGQKYGSDKKPEEQGNERQPKQNEENSGYQKMASQASDGALKRAAEDEKADPKVREMAKQELKKRGGGKEENGKEGKGSEKENNKEKKTDEKGKLNNKTANSVESAFKKLMDVYNEEAEKDDEDLDNLLAADEEFTDEIAEEVVKNGLTEQDFRKIQNSDVEWRYMDVDWGDIEDAAKEYKQNKREKSRVIKDIINDGADKFIDDYVDKNSKHYQNILAPYGVDNLFDLQEKLETEKEDDEKDPYGYDEYSKVYVKCLNAIPARKFKDFYKRISNV